MDVSALDDEGLEVWVTFLDAEVLMRYVGLDEVRRIRQHATLRRWPYSEVEGQRQGKPETCMDLAEASRLLGRAAVRGWKGLTLKDEDFPYSAENADLLMARWGEFARMVGEVSLDLMKFMERSMHESMEQSKKKSLTTSAPEGILAGSTATHAGT